MAANLNDEYEEKIDSLLTMFENSSSSGDEEQSDDNRISLSKLKSMEAATNLSDRNRWRQLETEIKLMKEHYLTIVKEKSVVIEEKNRIIEEKDRFMDEKMRFVEEKNRMAKPKESEVRNDNKSLEHKLKEAIEENKKLTKERDQLKQQVDDQRRFDKELNEIKEQLDEQVELVKVKDREIENAIEEKNRTMEEMRDKNESLKRELEQMVEEMDNFIKMVTWEVQDRDERLKHQLEEANEMKNLLKKRKEERDKLLIEKAEDRDRKRLEKELIEAKEMLDKQIKWVHERDDQVDELKKKLEQMMQRQAAKRVSAKNRYPKTVKLNRDLINYDLGFEIAPLPNGSGVYLSSVSTDSPAAKAGLKIGDRLLEVDSFNLRKANFGVATHVLRCTGPTVRMVVGAPVRIFEKKQRPVYKFYSPFPIDEEDLDDSVYQLVQIFPDKSLPKRKNKKKPRKKKGKKV